MERFSANRQPQPISRRSAMTGTAVAVGAATLASLADASTEEQSSSSFKYCLNTSTLRGQRLALDEVVAAAVRAGYDAIEPWVREIERFTETGGSIADLAKQCADGGLTIASAIAFAPWLADDIDERTKALERAKREMDLVRQLGGAFIAAPPAGATRGEQKIELSEAARRYADLLAVGREIGVTPQVEVWGFSNNLSRLGEAVYVAVESGAPEARVLPDVYHIYKGGSDFAGLKLLGRHAIHCFHLNDYPDDPPRTTISDEHRVWPGDGVAPIDQVLQALADNDNYCFLSLELFNPHYWRLDPLTAATTGLEKMKAAVAKAQA